MSRHCHVIADVRRCRRPVRSLWLGIPAWHVTVGRVAEVYCLRLILTVTCGMCTDFYKFHKRWIIYMSKTTVQIDTEKNCIRNTSTTQKRGNRMEECRDTFGDRWLPPDATAFRRAVLIKSCNCFKRCFKAPRFVISKHRHTPHVEKKNH